MCLFSIDFVIKTHLCFTNLWFICHLFVACLMASTYIHTHRALPCLYVVPICYPVSVLAKFCHHCFIPSMYGFLVKIDLFALLMGSYNIQHTRNPIAKQIIDKNNQSFLIPFNFCFTDAKNLTSVQKVEELREKVYASLEEYCRTQYPDEPGRFAKLLLRLPALRSIGLKCLEHLFFFKLIGDTPIDTFLMEMLEAPSNSWKCWGLFNQMQPRENPLAPPYNTK